MRFSFTLFRYVFVDLLRVFMMAVGALSGILSFGGMLRPLMQQGLDASQVGAMLAYFGPAMTAYVADMHAAWHAWAAWGRAAHPRLRVLFAMLAGGAPLHAERLTARGGPAGAVQDELTFFDVSSYGPRTVDAMLRVVGVDRLVYGSDAPVIEPAPLGLGESVAHALTEVNPARLLSLDPVMA